MYHGVVIMALRDRPLRPALMLTGCLILLATLSAQAQVPSVRIYRADPSPLQPAQLPWVEVSVLSQAVNAAGEPVMLSLPLAQRFPPVVAQGVADTALRSLSRPPTARVWNAGAGTYAAQQLWFQVVNPPTTDPVTGSPIQRYRFRVVPPGVRVPAVKVTGITPDATPCEDLTVIADPWICGTDTWTLTVDAVGTPTLTDGSGTVHDLRLVSTNAGTRYYESRCGALFIKIGPPDGTATTFTINTASNCWFSPAFSAGDSPVSWTLNGLQWGTGRVELQWQVDDNTAGVSTDDVWRVDANPDNYDNTDADGDGETLEFRTIAGVFSVSRELAFVDQNGDGIQEQYLDLGVAGPGAASAAGYYQVRNTALAPVVICPFCGAHLPEGTTTCPYDRTDLTGQTPDSGSTRPKYGPNAAFESHVATPPPAIPFESFKFAPLADSLGSGQADTDAWVAVKVPTFQPSSGAAPYGLANLDNNPAGAIDDPVPAVRLFTDSGGSPLVGNVWDAYLVCPMCGKRQSLEAVRDNGWQCTNPGCAGVRYEGASATPTVRSGRPYHGRFGQGAGPDIGMRLTGLTGATAAIKTLGADGARFQFILTGTTTPYRFRWGTVVPDGPPATNAPIPAFEVEAEDYDTIAVALSVPPVIPRLGTDVRTVDLGRVAPGDARSTAFEVYPSEFSVPGSFSAENWSNYPLDGTAGPQVLVQFSDLVPTHVDIYAASAGRMYQAGVVPSSTYELRDASGAPIPSIPAGSAQVKVFGPVSLNAQRPGELMGLQVPFSVQQGETLLVTAPVPNGTPAGTYRGTAVVFVDTNGNNLADPSEPQSRFQTRMTVTESWLPYNSAVAADSLPAGRIDVSPATGEPIGLQVFWASNRVDQGGTVPAPPDAFWNILYADAVPVVGDASNPGYRDYQWRTNRPAPAVDQPWLPFPSIPFAGDVYGSGPSMVANSSPATYQGTNGSWLAWQRRWTDPATGRTSSALLFNFDPQPPDGAHERPTGSVPVYNTMRTRENPSVFMAKDASASPPPANHWAFWQAGPEGRTQIYCNARFNPNDPTTVTDMRVPLSNALMRSSDPPQVTVPLDIGGAPVNVTIRKPRNWPYAFTKDPSACEYIRPLIGGGTASEINVFYSAWLSSEGNADVLWSRFDEATFGPDPNVNFGKLPFAPVTEDPQADAMRQVFRARHLDWITTAPDAALGQVGYAATGGGSVAEPDPLIQWWWRDTSGAVMGPFPITWDPAQSGFDESKGVYVLRGTNLVDPVTSMGITMVVDPTAGIVKFSRRLFNTLNPADPMAVINTGNTPTVEDVGLRVTYRPYTYRVTRSPDTDDKPSGFFDTFGRLTVFWRRTRATTEKPFFGDTSFWYRTYDLSAHVLRPPIAAVGSITDDGGTAIPATDWIADNANGYVRFAPAYEGRYVRINYSQAGGPGWTERHLIRGWGPEKPVPIETVISDAPVRVAQETYTIPGLGLQAVKYWLFWASTRDVYTGGGTSQTSDVYYTTVMP